MSEEKKARKEKVITDQQMEAILRLVDGTSVSQTAKEIGVTRNTIYYWFKIRRFQAELERVYTEGHKQQQRHWSIAANEACNSLRADLRSSVDAVRMHAQDSIRQHMIDLEKFEAAAAVEKIIKEVRNG